MKKVNIFSVAILCVSCLFSSLCYAKDISESEVKKIEAEAKQKALESKQLQARAIQLNLELSKIDKTVITLADKIKNNEKKLSDLEDNLVLLNQNLRAKEAEFEKENKSLVQTIAALQNMSLTPSESVILQPLSPIDIIRSAILLRETVPYLSQKSSKLKVDLDNVYNQKKKIEANLEESKKQKKLLTQQQNEMRRLMAKKSSLRQEVEAKGAETQKLAQNLSSKARDLRELLEELERQKELARKKQEEERLAQLKKQRELEQKGIVRTVDTKTHATIKKQVSGNSFAHAKGTLSKPVSGSKITDYGQTISKGVTSKGIVYKTRSEAQVTSLFDGTVIFSGPFKGYGNIIIVEHGGGYLSLLAGLGHIDCDVGQKLLRGEPVGTMPKGDKSKLYVEIRKDRHPINPAPWIAG